MGIRGKALLASVVALMAVAAPGIAGAAQQHRYHVTYGLAAGPALIAHGLDAAGSPPGANDWNCTPSAEHPEPVILLHGLTANAALNWNTISPLLANNGYCVFALTYGQNKKLLYPLNQPGGLIDMRTSASNELAPFVDKVLAATGAKKVDFVGHSEGTVMPRYYLRYLGGADKVAKSVNMTPLWKGTNLLLLADLNGYAKVFGLEPIVTGLLGFVTDSSYQFLTGSDYLNSVNSGEAFPHQIQFTSIATKYDELVAPYTNGLAPGVPNMTNITLQDACPNDTSEHLLEAVDPVTAQYVLNALDPAQAEPIQCNGVPRNSD